MAGTNSTDPDEGYLAEVYLAPGEFFFSGEPTRVRTLLGSCVSITLWHPVLRVGGMCHYMLPSRGSHLANNPDYLDGRYADEAIMLFLGNLRRFGTQPREYVAKIFGGGNQFPSGTSAALDISRGNVAAGLRLLRRHQFTLTSQHLGGTGFRKLSFDLATGEVILSHVTQGS